MGIDSSRLGSVCNLRNLGLHFRQEKLEAIIRGDLSGTVVHPGLIHFMHALGPHYCHVTLSPLAVRMQAVHVQLLWEGMADILKGDNNELKLQIQYLAASAYIFVRMAQNSKLFLWKCITRVDSMGMRFVPAYGRPPEISEGLRENVACLSQVIYLDNYLFLAFDGPSPKQTARIEMEFLHEFKVRNAHFFLACKRAEGKIKETYPILFDICPLIMRTEGILLVRGATLLLRFYASGGEFYCFVRS